MGYCPEGLFFTQIRNTAGGKEALKIKNELRRFPFVEGVTVVSALPLGGLSGNAIVPPGERKSLFSTRWLRADEDFLEVMQIPLLEGNPAKGEFRMAHKAVVNQQFTKKLKLQPGEMFGSDYGETVLLGICRDFNVSSLYKPQEAFMMEYLDLEHSMAEQSLQMIIRLQSVTPEHLAELHKSIAAVVPEQQPVLYDYEAQLLDNYSEVHYMRNVILLVRLLAFTMTILGLIGFVGDEVSRRTKEIAVRKINGATVPDVIGLLWKDAGWITFYTLPVGLVAAYLLGYRWLQQFAVKLPLNGWIFIGGLCITLCIILFTIALRSYGAAVANPVKSLKNE